MLKPTLVNTESPSSWILESGEQNKQKKKKQNPQNTQKWEKKVKGKNVKTSVSGEPSSTPSADSHSQLGRNSSDWKM